MLSKTNRHKKLVHDIVDAMAGDSIPKVKAYFKRLTSLGHAPIDTEIILWQILKVENADVEKLMEANSEWPWPSDTLEVITMIKDGSMQHRWSNQTHLTNLFKIASLIKRAK